MLWRKICSVCTVLVLAGLLFLNAYGSPITRYVMVQDVTDLLSEHGYQEEDLLKVQSAYHKGEQKKYTVQVVFKEKPESTYFYYYDVNHMLQVQNQ